jgi:hypothetical protein
MGNAATRCVDSLPTTRYHSGMPKAVKLIWKKT